MIYLIDDNVIRQKEFGWDEKRFIEFQEILHPIFHYPGINDMDNDIPITGNTILFHESFAAFDSDQSPQRNALSLRKELTEFAQLNKAFKLVIFSGSKNSRKLDGNIGFLPVSILYQNLNTYLNKAILGDEDLKYLFYGENPEVEKLLLLKLKEANNELEPVTKELKSDSPCFIAQTVTDDIGKIFLNATYDSFYLDEQFDDDITDEYLDAKVKEWFSEIEYQNIFIPLCFGPTLSDFNGLRFALHIRCTETPNQLKNIFLYSFVDYSFFYRNEYFDILKTKNVFLIDYKIASFESAVISKYNQISNNDLRNEISRIKLNPPKNFHDHHSIANIWAIYQWSSAINVEDRSINIIKQNFQSNIYFKYLKTIFKRSENINYQPINLNFKYSGRPKVLYVDDEAEKGWDEILLTIFYDINGIEFCYLDEEFESKSSEEVVKIVIERIISDKIDFVLLDYRLHSDDFDVETVGHKITGLRLLEEIKKINPGIQVIVFSATNKVWNLQAFLMAGADGFIVKESPELSNFKNTDEIIISSINTISRVLEKVFLKDFYEKFTNLKHELIPRKNIKKSDKPLPKEFVDEVLKWLELSYSLLNGGISQISLTAAFLLMFSVLENLANRTINIDAPIEIYDYPGKYNFKFRQSDDYLMFFRFDEATGLYHKTGIIHESDKNIPWFIKILNTLDFVARERASNINLSKIIKVRNSIIHANTTTGKAITVELSQIIELNDIIYKGLINVT